MNVIRNPVESHLPPSCRKIGTSVKAPLVDLDTYVQALSADEPVVFVIGAMAHGAVNAPYVEEEIGISQYPLSGAAVCSRVCTAFERKWGIH
jgi:rRNA small subunit pseudouridine methyltransferase Nep1